MNSVRYKMSFSTGGLFYHESVKLAALYLKLGDWLLVRETTLNNNLMQTRTLSSSKRICREVISRLKPLSHAELELLIEGNHQEQAYLLWLAVCRQYKFIADFAIEVLHERYITLKSDLNPEDFITFFNRKSEWNSELDDIRPTTLDRLRQVLFKMLREADLLATNGAIIPAMPSPRLLALISRGKPEDVLYFPIFESDLKGML